MHYITAIHEDEFVGLVACHCSDLILVPRKYGFAKDVQMVWNDHLREMEK